MNTLLRREATRSHWFSSFLNCCNFERLLNLSAFHISISLGSVYCSWPGFTGAHCRTSQAILHVPFLFVNIELLLKGKTSRMVGYPCVQVVYNPFWVMHYSLIMNWGQGNWLMPWYSSYTRHEPKKTYMKNIAEASFLEKVCVAPVEYVFHKTKPYK